MQIQGGFLCLFVYIINALRFRKKADGVCLLCAARDHLWMSKRKAIDCRCFTQRVFCQIYHRRTAKAFKRCLGFSAVHAAAFGRRKHRRQHGRAFSTAKWRALRVIYKRYRPNILRPTGNTCGYRERENAPSARSLSLNETLVPSAISAHVRAR